MIASDREFVSSKYIFISSNHLITKRVEFSKNQISKGDWIFKNTSILLESHLELIFIPLLKARVSKSSHTIKPIHLFATLFRKMAKYHRLIAVISLCGQFQNTARVAFIIYTNRRIYE